MTTRDTKRHTFLFLVKKNQDVLLSVFMCYSKGVHITIDKTIFSVKTPSTLHTQSQGFCMTETLCSEIHCSNIVTHFLRLVFTLALFLFALPSGSTWRRLNWSMMAPASDSVLWEERPLGLSSKPSFLEA